MKIGKLWAGAAAMLLAGAANAAIVTLNVTAELDLSDTVFGLTGHQTLNGSLTYDTSLNTSTVVAAAGDPLPGGRTAGTNFYGYSSSGITAFNFVFGSKTFDVSDLRARVAAAGFGADFFVDQELGVATPSQIWMGLSDRDGSLTLGTGTSNDGALFLTSTTSVDDSLGDGLAVGAVTAITADVAQGPGQVPEPASVALFGLGLLALVGTRKRRSQA